MKTKLTIAVMLLMITSICAYASIKNTAQKENSIVILETIPKGKAPNWIKDYKEEAQNYSRYDLEQDSNICIVTKGLYYKSVNKEEVKKTFSDLDELFGVNFFSNKEVRVFPEVSEVKKYSFETNKEKIIADFKNEIFMNFAEISLELNAYKDNNGKILKEVFLENTDKIEIPELFVKDTYIEELEETTDSGNKIQFWNIFTLFTLSIETYNKKTKEIFNKTYKQIKQNKQATKLLKEIESKFYGK